MADSPITEIQATSPVGKQKSQLVLRHSLTVRITHWVMVLCVYVLLLSGFQIFNAHPALYWGESSDFENPLLIIGSRRNADKSLTGVTSVFGQEFDTTGILGVSSNDQGGLSRRGFPSWLTVPGPQWLAMGRRWHFFFAWVIVLTGLVYVIHSLRTRHFTNDLLLRHTDGESPASYHLLQKLAYLGVIFGLAPLLLLTGLGMSPRLDPLLGGLVGLAGGRQSVRTLHFVFTLMLVLFIVVHLVSVLITGPWNNLRSMITGKYRISEKRGDRNESAST